MNGVCVVWKGWIDLQRLDGAGYLEFDEDKAKVSHISTYKFFFFILVLFLLQIGRVWFLVRHLGGQFINSPNLSVSVCINVLRRNEVSVTT